MIVLYLTFGTDPVVHQQATFSALTFLARGADEVTVLTDAPEYYAALAGKAKVQTITDADLRDWKGPHDFFWRIKIRALQQLAATYPGQHLIYLDADTFCFADPEPLLTRLRAGGHLMHAREGKPAELPTSTERKMGKQTVGKTFGGIRITADHAMFNAGVVALSGTRAAEAAARALEICDDMCAAGVTRRLVEQFALSIALRETGGVETANAVVGHYWGNKVDWNAFIGRFLLTHYLTGSSLEERIAATRDVDFHALPVYRRSSSTQKKFHRWISEKIRTMPTTFIPAPGAPVSDLSERWRAKK